MSIRVAIVDGDRQFLLKTKECIVRDQSDKDIAGQLGVGEGTVHSHLHNIYGKYHVKSRGAASLKYLGN